jgi:hypothetical protein
LPPSVEAFKNALGDLGSRKSSTSALPYLEGVQELAKWKSTRTQAWRGILISTVTVSVIRESTWVMAGRWLRLSATRNVYDLTSDISSIFSSEEANRSGNVVRLPQSSNWRT